MYADDIKELICMTKKELLNISDWLKVNKLNAVGEHLLLKLNNYEIKRVEKTRI